MADAAQQDDPGAAIRQRRTTAGQKRPRLYDGIASESLVRPSAVTRTRPTFAKPSPIAPPVTTTPLPPPPPDVVHEVGWARSPSYPHWPCVVIDPSVAVAFPAVHGLFVSSSLARKALVQYFGMHAPQFEVVSLPPRPVADATIESLASAVDPMGDSVGLGAIHPASSAGSGGTFLPWGCPRQAELEGGAAKIPSRRSGLRRAFKQGVQEARAVHEAGPQGGLARVAALIAVPGMRVVAPGVLVPVPAAFPVAAAAEQSIAGVGASGETGTETQRVQGVPQEPQPEAHVAEALAEDDVWGLEGSTTEDEV